jgi:alkylhydroperoxidase family enzyme
MARIPILHEDQPDIADAARLFLRERLDASGRVTNITRVMANNPTLARAFFAFTGSFYGGGTLTPKQRELVYTTATAVNQCFY